MNGTGVNWAYYPTVMITWAQRKKVSDREKLPGPANPFHFNKPVEVLEDLDSGGTDEGRALLEIVHDVAPGSALAFHTADLGEADFCAGYPGSCRPRLPGDCRRH